MLVNIYGVLLRPVRLAVAAMNPREMYPDLRTVGTYGLRRMVSRITENYTYAAADNLADNGTYHRYIKSEVTARRASGRESRAQSVEIEVGL